MYLPKHKFFIKILSSLLSYHVHCCLVDKHCSDICCDEFLMPQIDRKSKQERQLSGLAYIPTCRSPSPQTFITLAVTEQAAACFSASKVLSIFQFLTLGCLPLGPRSPIGETTYYPPRSTILQNCSTIAQTIYEICVTKVFHVLAPGGLTPGPKFTKRGEVLADSDIYHPAKFHRSMPTHARDICYQTPADKQKNKQTKKQ